MKKLFDKYVAQSSRGQILALALAFLVLVVLGGFIGRSVASSANDDNLGDFGRPETWGFMQCVDGGFVQATIHNNTKYDGDKVKEPAPMSVIALSLGFWLGGMVLVSFFTGVATDFLNSRREKILAGGIDYDFKKDYILIAGFDFQVKNLIKQLLKSTDNPECRGDKRGRAFDVVVVTDADVAAIHGELLPELGDGDARRLFIVRKDIALDESYGSFRVTGAEEIYLIGDGEAVGRDGKTLRALEAITRKAESELKGKSSLEKQIKVYMHIEDSVLYSQVRAMKLPADEALVETTVTIFDLEVYNYYESWAWECWSHRDSKDGDDAYLPLRHRQGSKHVELFVIGAGRMGRAMVNFAMPLMNYGEDGKHCKITVFDPDGLKKGFLPDCEILDSLPETTVEFKEMDGCSDDANDIMLAAARKPDTSVTVVIALSDPGAAVRAYSELSNRLRRENVSVLVWQAAHSKNCPSRKYLMMGGPGDKEHPNLADRTAIRYFGMTDRLPWKNPDRFNYGMAVNYYYNCWFPYPKYSKKAFDASWSEKEILSLQFNEKGDPILTKEQEARLVESVSTDCRLFRRPASPKVQSVDFVGIAKSMWTMENPAASKTGDKVAGIMWVKTERWKKWSSVNSGDTFKEKAVLFDGVSCPVAAERILRAEHNRWWTEKLLTGWMYDPNVATNDESHADKKRMLHGDMVPFERLSEGVKDKDKINIAAMAAYDFI